MATTPPKNQTYTTQPIGTVGKATYPTDNRANATTQAALVKSAKAQVAALGVANRNGADDPYGGLQGTDRDAAVAIENLFDSYGLKSLAPQIIQMIQKGESSDTISILLQDTPEYKQRFAANDLRLKAGLPVLSPAEYISTERSYRQVMQSAGLPIGFYDSTDDFKNFLAADVSPTEVKSRVDAVSEAIDKAPPETTAYFKQFYNTGDMIAYALDPTKAQPLIDQRLKAAEAAAVANTQGVNLSQTNAELIGGVGSSLGDIQTGLGFIGQEGVTADKLSNIYGGADVTQDDLVKEVFAGDGAAGAKRKILASQERGTFGGASSQSKNSLTNSSEGSI